MRSKGFTLIELMIVVAIIAILSAIALPAYQDYVARSQVAEGLVVAGGAKIAVTEYHAHNGEWPDSHAAMELAAAQSITGRYVSSTSVGNDGRITVAYNRTATSAKIRNADLVLVPRTSDSTVYWDCEGSVDPRYRPSSCR
ncbi:pilin [Luteimonas deserti]|nr:pilin [Luteimonas deserti]